MNQHTELAAEAKQLAEVLRGMTECGAAPDDLWEQDQPDGDAFVARAAELLEALAALAQPTQDGGEWQMVPKEPTKAMRRVGAGIWQNQSGHLHQVTGAMYRAMLAAAPQAAQPYPLPDSLYPGSKDWQAADYAGRVEWLHQMYEGKKMEVEELTAQAAQPVGEAGSSVADKALRAVGAQLVSEEATTDAIGRPVLRKQWAMPTSPAEPLSKLYARDQLQKQMAPVYEAFSTPQPADTRQDQGASPSGTALSAPALRASAPIAGATYAERVWCHCRTGSVREHGCTDCLNTGLDSMAMAAGVEQALNDAYAEGRKDEAEARGGTAETAHLAMLVRVLCHHLKKHDAHSTAIARAMDYLQRHGLSSPLRDARGMEAAGRDPQGLGSEGPTARPEGARPEASAQGGESLWRPLVVVLLAADHVCRMWARYVDQTHAPPPYIAHLIRGVTDDVRAALSQPKGDK